MHYVLAKLIICQRELTPFGSISNWLNAKAMVAELYLSTNEAQSNEEINNVVSEQVRHKPACAATDG